MLDDAIDNLDEFLKFSDPPNSTEEEIIFSHNEHLQSIDLNNKNTELDLSLGLGNNSKYKTMEIIITVAQLCNIQYFNLTDMWRNLSKNHPTSYSPERYLLFDYILIHTGSNTYHSDRVCTPSKVVFHLRIYTAGSDIPLQ